ncbi:MbtH family protein [Microbulbifer thermotolerans]|uniref:MbtH family protein n=1 Tax=Microbulbifer thermotolerans TaxID=252514 RepID=UPI002249052D|nr:MbtH family protein [Microbulbifer thermotolerans]MCX2796207.1 MbtH family protein [Microbulbifer thermotolerans]
MREDEYNNPFDSEDKDFLVLKNAYGQYSLWPDFMAIPTGWESVYGPEARRACDEFIEAHWQAINPFSVSGKQLEAQS